MVITIFLWIWGPGWCSFPSEIPFSFRLVIGRRANQLSPTWEQAVWMLGFCLCEDWSLYASAWLLCSGPQCFRSRSRLFIRATTTPVHPAVGHAHSVRLKSSVQCLNFLSIACIYGLHYRCLSPSLPLPLSMHTEGRTQGCGSHLQATERGLPWNQPCWYLDLRLPASSIVRKSLLFKPPSLWHFVMTAWANSYKIENPMFKNTCIHTETLVFLRQHWPITAQKLCRKICYKASPDGIQGHAFRVPL